MFLYRPYRCQVCNSEKEILSDSDSPCADFCDSCSDTPDRYADQAHAVTAFGSTRTLRPFKCIEAWIDMDVDLHEDVIAHSHLFDGMSSWQVKRVIMLGDTRRYQPGETIVAQGQSDQFTYVLLSGRARVMIASGSGVEVQAATIEMGEVFGEVAAILGMSRTASVIAETQALVFGLDATAIERIGKFYPRIAYYVARNNARVLGIRFRGVNAELAEWKQLRDSTGDAE